MEVEDYWKLYIAVLDEVPDHMVPTLVAHTMLGAHLSYLDTPVKTSYLPWLHNSFRKVVVKVNQREFDKIRQLHPDVYVRHENTVLKGRKSCAIPLPVKSSEVPKALLYAKLWKPNGSN